MLRSVLPLLRCPFCAHGGVTEQRPDSGPQDRIINGTLRCTSCQDTTEVRDTIWHAMGPHLWNKTLAQITNIAPPVAALYERAWRRHSLTRLSGRYFPNREELDELVAATAPSPGQVFVDVACSEGLYARELSRHGATVFAVDHSVAFLKRVVKHTNGSNVIAVRAMAQHLPLSSSALEGAVMGASLNEIGDQQQAINEMARVLKVGGAFFSMSLTTARTKPGQLLQRALALSGITVPSDAETQALITGAGLRITQIKRDRIVFRATATSA